MDVQLPRVLYFAPLANGTYLACVFQGERLPGDPLLEPPLVLASAGSKEFIKKWDAPVNWGYSHTGASRNGRFAVAIFYESHPRDWENEQRRIGLLDISSREIRWVAELNGKVYGEIRQITASDDGRYVAIGGWRNGAVVVDTSAQKVLWSGRSPEANSISYVTFSPDGLTLYEGDSGGGCVYVVETKTGKILQQRYATDTGKAIYGHRISCLATSADGAWIAAGTGPEGQVFLFEAAAPQAKPIMLRHGFGTILMVSFAPDSKHLASVAGGVIKIWAVPPSRPGASQPASTPATRPSLRTELDQKQNPGRARSPFDGRSG